MSQRPVSSRCKFDSLEGRRLLSAAATPVADNIVTVRFKGHDVRAIAGEYVVQAKSPAKFVASAAKAGLTDVKSLGLDGYFSFSTSWDITRAQKWAKANASISLFQPNTVMTLDAVPNDPYLKYQYAINNTGQVTPNPVVITPANSNGDATQPGVVGQDLDLYRAWDITTGSKNVVVAVMDTGLDVKHPDLIPNLWQGGDTSLLADTNGDGYVGDMFGWNAADQNGDLTDLVGHGTAVSSCIGAAGNDGQGVVGANWAVSIMMVKIADASGALTLSGIIGGYSFVVQQKRRGVNISALNLSFGSSLDEVITNPVEASAIRRLTDAGIVVVTSAGNGGVDGIGDNLDYGSGGTQNEAITNPRAVVVAAINNQGALSSFSNYGPGTVTIGAPGVQTLMDASADALEDSANTNLPFLTNTADGSLHGFISADGTSFASPYTAGVIGLMEAAYEQANNGAHATADQLVAALKAGAARTPQLDGENTSGVPLVSTGGRVDAYNSIRILTTRTVGQNTTTQGNWLGKYGSAGNYVYGLNNAAAPATLTSAAVPSNSEVINYGKKVKVTDNRLLTSADQTTRSDGYLFAPDSLSFAFDFGTATQRLTFYAASIDNSKRVENITVVDAQTGITLQSAALSSFSNGKYVSFDVSGKVGVALSGGSAGTVLNAIYVDTAPVTGLPVLPTDTITKGNWINTYGDLGYVLPSGGSSFPSFLTSPVSTLPSATAQAVSGKPSGGNIALLAPASTTTRIGGYFTNPIGILDFRYVLTDSSARSISFYFANSTSKPAGVRLLAFNTATGQQLNSADVQLTKGGEYVTLPVSGDTTFRVTSLVAGVLPTVSGVFFNSSTTPRPNSANSAGFLGVDTTTQGNFRGKFGYVDTINPSFINSAGNFYIVGAASTFTPTITGSYVAKVIAPSTNKKSALINVTSGTGQRVVGYLQSQSTMTIIPTSTTATATDLATPLTLSAYFVDFDNKNRVQRVEIVDSDTKAVLSTQTIGGFKDGKYLSWRVTGKVEIRITRISGPDAVVSGIFET